MLAYTAARALLKPLHWLCIPSTVLHLERVPDRGPVILAPTHIAHLEPFVLSLILRGEVRWMARSELYCNAVCSAAMRAVGTFEVRRQGDPRPALREAVRLLGQGERVGIFPEAGVSRRQYSAMRGGPIKLGACFLALHGQAPIIPIAVVGTHAMNRVGPWLPFRRAPIAVAVGRPILPGPLPDRLSEKRARRKALGEALQGRYQSLYQELLTLPGIDDQHDLHPNQPVDPAAVGIDPHSAAGSVRRHAPGRAS